MMGEDTRIDGKPKISTVDTQGYVRPAQKRISKQQMRHIPPKVAFFSYIDIFST